MISFLLSLLQFFFTFLIYPLLFLGIAILLIFWYPISQRLFHRFGQTTNGHIISTQTRTYSGSYGRRYTKYQIVYEFQDHRGRTWRGRLAPQNHPFRKSILVYYWKQYPRIHKAVTSQKIVEE